MPEVQSSQKNVPFEDRTVNDIHVILPVGGRATRALEVTEDRIPKHLIRLKSGHFVLDRIMHGLQHEGYEKFVFCTGHHSEAITSYIASERWRVTDAAEVQASYEDDPLGPDGAVLKAIDELNLDGEALILPGDVSLPWNKLADMSLFRRRTESDVTLAVTSKVTPRTTDVGKLIVNESTSRLEHCFGRDECVTGLRGAQKALTSAAALAINIERYLIMCEQYKMLNPGINLLSMRDDIAPWASSSPQFKMTAYDIQGEILDLGTPKNIIFGQECLDE